SGRSASVFFLHVSRSRTYLAVSPHHEAGAGQLAQAHRAVRVQLAGRDADLRSQAQLPAVVEPGRGIHQGAARVDFAHEPLGETLVAGADGLGMAGTVTRDVSQRTFHAVDDRHGELQVEELPSEVVRDGRPRAGQPRERPRIGPQLDA